MSMEPAVPPADVFDDGHYASTVLQKLKRSLQLGPKYYWFDIPRYFRSRHALNLPLWDFGALLNPLREWRRQTYCEFPLPPGYAKALGLLGEAGERREPPPRPRGEPPGAARGGSAAPRER